MWVFFFLLCFIPLFILMPGIIILWFKKKKVKCKLLLHYKSAPLHYKGAPFKPSGGIFEAWSGRTWWGSVFWEVADTTNSSQAPKSLMDLSECLHNVQCDAKSPSSETPFSRKPVNVQLRMVVGCGVKGAVVVSRLFLCLCWEEEQPGLSHLPGVALFSLGLSRCHGQTGENHCSV